MATQKTTPLALSETTSTLGLEAQPEGDSQEQKPKKILQGWQQKAAHDLAHSDLSYKAIADRYGRQRDTIIKLRQRLGIERPKVSRSNQKTNVEAQAISPVHRALGVRLNLFRGKMTVTETANLLGISRQRFQSLELGTEDLNLSLLLKISETLGLTVTECLSEYRMQSVSKMKGK